MSTTHTLQTDQHARRSIPRLCPELAEQWLQWHRMLTPQLATMHSARFRQIQRWCLEDNQRMARLCGVDLLATWFLDTDLADDERPHWDEASMLVRDHLHSLDIQVLHGDPRDIDPPLRVRGVPNEVRVLVAPGQGLGELGIDASEVMSVLHVSAAIWLDVRVTPSLGSIEVLGQHHTVLALELEVEGAG